MKLSDRLVIGATTCRSWAEKGIQPPPEHLRTLAALLDEAHSVIVESEQRAVDEEFSHHQRAMEGTDESIR